MADGITQHISMRGKVVDMELIRKKNELTPAIGNARVNARGDELGAGGKIIRKREDIVHEYYENNPNSAKEEYVAPRARANAVQSPAIIPTTVATTPDVVKTNDIDSWQEDADGNFVKPDTKNKKSPTKPE